MDNLNIKYSTIIASSLGNCTVIDNLIVDIGISYKKLAMACDLDSIKAILITHEHGDHFNIATIKKIAMFHPQIKFISNKSVCNILKNNNLKCIEIKQNQEIIIKTNLKKIKIFSEKLEHDVECIGFHIHFHFVDTNKKVKCIYLTDCKEINHINAQDYDLFFIADGGTKEDIINAINSKLENGEYVYEYRKLNNHLVTEQTDAFFIKNKKDTSKLIRLHCRILNKGVIKWVTAEVE